MVVFHPTNTQWTTTNSAYGEFYVSVHKEVRRLPEPAVHKDCTKKAEALGKELDDVKSKLECLTQRCKREPCPKTGYILPPGSDLNLKLFSPKIGKCDSPNGPGPPNANPYISVCKNEYNGAKLHDPQFLEGHIKKEHPRLVKRVSPPKPYSTQCITGSSDHFPGHDDDGSRQRPRQCKMIGLYKRPSTDCPPRCASHEKFKDNTMRVKVYDANGNNLTSMNGQDCSDTNRLPNDQRYNFYRYYDKCPKGFNLEDIFDSDPQGTYTDTLHEDFLNEIFPNIKSFTPPNSNLSLSCNDKVARMVECSTLTNDVVKNTNFDFCCYANVSNGERLNVIASKVSEYFEADKSNVPYSDVQTKALSSPKGTQVPYLDVQKNNLSSQKGTQTLESTHINNPPKDIVELSSSNSPRENKYKPTLSSQKGTQTLESTHINNPPKDIVELSSSNSPRENKDKPTPTVNKDLLETTSALCPIDETKKLDKNMTESTTLKKTSIDISENKCGIVATWDKKIETKNEVVTKNKLLYEFDIFLTPNHNILNCPNSVLHRTFFSKIEAYKDGAKVQQDTHPTKIDCKSDASRNSKKSSLCYEVELSQSKDGKKLGSFDINLEDENSNGNKLRFMKPNDRKSQANSESRELCFEADFTTKGDEGCMDIVENKAAYKHNNKNNSERTQDILFGESNIIKREPRAENSCDLNSNIDSPSNSDVLRNISETSTNKSSFLSSQSNNEIKQSFSPPTYNKSNSCSSEPINQIEITKNSSKNLIFDPKDPLFLNLCTNYGQNLSQLNRNTKVDKKV